MEKLYSDLTIHSITIPLSTREMVISVGKEISSTGLTVTRIHRDEDNYEFFGTIRYAIYAHGKDKKEFLWRSISEGSNPILTFDANQ